MVVCVNGFEYIKVRLIENLFLVMFFETVMYCDQIVSQTFDQLFAFVIAINCDNGCLQTKLDGDAKQV